MLKAKMPGLGALLVFAIYVLVFSKGRVLAGSIESDREPTEVPPDDMSDEKTLKIVIAERFEASTYF